MKKFSVFIHKAFDQKRSQLVSATALIDCLFRCAMQQQDVNAFATLFTPHDGNQWWSGVNVSDFAEALAQSHRIEVHIQPSSDVETTSSRLYLDALAVVRCYSSNFKDAIYALEIELGSTITGWSAASMCVLRRDVGSGLFLSRKLNPMLTDGQTLRVPFDGSGDWLDIAVARDEILRVRYRWTINDHPPRGGDYFDIQHFRKQREVSSVRIKVSPCRDYLISIGHDLMLLPTGEMVTKRYPMQPSLHRYSEWVVQKLNIFDWAENDQVKHLPELAVQES